MVHRCVVRNCSNTSSKTKGITYHGLPSDEKKRKRWLEEITRHGGFRDSKRKSRNCDNVVICGDHFAPESYESLVDWVQKTPDFKLCSKFVFSLFATQQKKTRKNSGVILNPEDNLESQIEQTALDSSLTNTVPFVLVDPGVDDFLSISVIDERESAENVSFGNATTQKNKRIIKRKSKINCRMQPTINSQDNDKLIKAREMIKTKTLIIKRQRMEFKRKNDKIRMLTEQLEKLQFASRAIIDNIRKLSQEEDKGDTYASIMMDQLRNYGKKKGARWNQQTIKNSIILHGRSSSTFKYIREIDFPHLVEERIKSEARRLSDIEKLGSLQVDEMTIKPKEKFNKNFGKYFGRVDMGNVVKDSTSRLANKVLGFVFSGLSTRFHIPVAIYLSPHTCRHIHKLTAEQQTKLTIHVIQELAIYGFRVIRLVTDNLSVNVKMFNLLNDGVSCPVVLHPVDGVRESAKWPCVFRPLFLSYDPCHVIKNVRNQFIDRLFLVDGQVVTFQLIRKIFEKQIEGQDLVKPVRFLTRVHVDANNLERQRIKPAVDVFRPEVRGTIIMNHGNNVDGFEDIEDTVKFLQKRLPDKMHFVTTDDSRLLWLIQEFLIYLDKWQQDVSIRVNAIYTRCKDGKQRRKEEKKTGFTNETYDALKFTTLSTVASTQYLLDLEFAFVLTRKFSSDDIELFFSAIRQMMGGNFQGDAYGVVTVFEKILRTGIANASIGSNVILRIETPREYELIRAQKTTRKREKMELTFLPSFFLIILDELLVAPKLPSSNSEVATVAYLGGYCLYILKEWDFCEECVDKLQQQKNMSPHLSYIRNLDRGGLLYPIDEFIARLWTIYSFTKAAISTLEGCTTILKDMVDFLVPKLEQCSSFQCELAQPGENNKELVV